MKKTSVSQWKVTQLRMREIVAELAFVSTFRSAGAHVVCVWKMSAGKRDVSQWIRSHLAWLQLWRDEIGPHS